MKKFCSLEPSLLTLQNISLTIIIFTHDPCLLTFFILWRQVEDIFVSNIAYEAKRQDFLMKSFNKMQCGCYKMLDLVSVCVLNTGARWLSYQRQSEYLSLTQLTHLTPVSLRTIMRWSSPPTGSHAPAPRSSLTLTPHYCDALPRSLTHWRRHQRCWSESEIFRFNYFFHLFTRHWWSISSHCNVSALVII